MQQGRIKNWAEFQHYKDRSPPWIKLHRALLDDMEYALLSGEAGKALALIWLIASESEGSLPELRQLAFRLRLSPEKTTEIVQELRAAGFIVDNTTPAERLATPAQVAGCGSRHISDKVKVAVWSRDGGKCCSCGSQDKIEYDHIIPVSRGGSSDFDNIQLLCRTCNRKKRVSATPAQPPRSLETETEGETEREPRASGKRKTKAAEQPLAGWIAGLAGGDAIPADDPIFAWAGKQGIPTDWIGYAWAAFEDRYTTTKQDKTYTDWRATFRDHVKRGWLDVWRLDARSGGYVLTTAGEQWRREVSA